MTNSLPRKTTNIPQTEYRKSSSMNTFHLREIQNIEQTHDDNKSKIKIHI